MTEQEFNAKWNQANPYEMDTEQLREYKQDCFAMYEETGFTTRFDSPYDHEREHNGMRFEVIRRAREYNSEGNTEEERGEVDMEVMPVWLVRFENGDEAYCYPEEICKAEHKQPSIIKTASELEELIKEEPGTTRAVHLPNLSDDDPESNNPLHATVISHPTGKAVLLHWGLNGDWTGALLLPETLFDEDNLQSVQDGIEWFDDV